jgi:DNA polymerase I
MEHGAHLELEGILVDIDYVSLGKRSIIRLVLKSGGKAYTLLDYGFRPYFFIVPGSDSVTAEQIAAAKARDDEGAISAYAVEPAELSLKGSAARAFRVTVESAREVPKLSEILAEFGERYEYDILFWKRYVIDKRISPLYGVNVKAHEEGGELRIDSIAPSGAPLSETLTHLCFDIETYNPLTVPRPDADPVIMISYTDGKNEAVLTTKDINRKFIRVFPEEKDMINSFTEYIKSNDYDVIAGYNSSNFDIPYLLKRAAATKSSFSIGRHEGMPKQEHHGLLEMVKIPGRSHVDVYNIAKFVSIVGASEKVLKASRFTLKEVYAAITGDVKKMVERQDIWRIWDGSDAEREDLAEYSLADSLALDELYRFFVPLEIEISKVVGTTLSESCISTTGQLVEHLLMRSAFENNEFTPNKPTEREIAWRNSNPIEGAYVKTPEAGIYRDIAVFDFRGLYPSIIIAYNIDPSTLVKDPGPGDYHVSPTKAKFRKAPAGIVPKVLKILINERSEAKKAFKKDPDNKALAARQTALKIIANSFYGYLGYARSRWYSRECAESVTAFGREYISKTMELAEKHGFKVLYGDTDSIFLLMGGRGREDAKKFLNDVNKSLPDSMELELEDFYTSGVFVGKRGAGSRGAKKKYALLSESGRIKIRGFELVRRDWSGISRNTQRAVLETILKEGSKEKAMAIVKDVVKRLRDGEIPIRELSIQTQLRKKIDAYDAKSPELAAVKKAIERKQKNKSDMEGTMVNYVITRHGSTISEKAELEEFAEDYDAEYYINHQVIPSTLKILKELGISEDELKGLGSQKKLF